MNVLTRYIELLDDPSHHAFLPNLKEILTTMNASTMKLEEKVRDLETELDKLRAPKPKTIRRSSPSLKKGVDYVDRFGDES